MTHRPLHQGIYHQGTSYEVLKETFLKIGIFWDMIFLIAFSTTDKSYNPQKIEVKWNTNLMQHCAGFISAVSLYMFRAQAPIIRSI